MKDKYELYRRIERYTSRGRTIAIDEHTVSEMTDIIKSLCEYVEILAKSFDENASDRDAIEAVKLAKEILK